jgi:hypothetical protein
MFKGILMLGIGVAAVGIARFACTAIADERHRRRATRDSHETTRWEGEGGNVATPATAHGGGPAVL